MMHSMAERKCLHPMSCGHLCGPWPGFWLPEKERIGPWLYSTRWEVCKLGGVFPGGCKILTGASCRLASAPALCQEGGELWADDVVVSGSSQVADHPLETVTASVDQHSELIPELWKTGNYNRLYFYDLEKRTQARNGCRLLLSETHFKPCLEMKLFDAHLEACPRDALQKRSVSWCVKSKEKEAYTRFNKVCKQLFNPLARKNIFSQPWVLFSLGFLLNSVYSLL